MSKENKKALVVQDSLLLNVESFEHAWRVGGVLASSTLVPEHFRNNVGNCVIALNYAHRVSLDPFLVMQKMYVIKGKPAIEAQLQIALFNNSTRFSTLRYKFSGELDSRKCVAFAQDLSTNEVLYGPEVSIQMSKDEGWYQKNGSKWKTLPDLMLRYRSASFFIKTYAPETTFGMNTKDEAEDSDIIDVTPEKIFETEADKNANKKLLKEVKETKLKAGKSKAKINHENHVTPEMSNEEKAEAQEMNEMDVPKQF